MASPSLELFAPRPGALVRASVTDAVVRWPGGLVRWRCGEPGAERVDAAWETHERRFYAWALPRCRVELALWRVVPELPEGMQIAEGWIGHWRVRLEAAGRLPRLRCSLADGDEGYEGSPENGESLDAKTWEDDRYRITIGTEDSEALASRAGETLPSEWRTPLHALVGARSADGWEYPVRHEPDGVALMLPEAPGPQVCDFHHAVAWQDVGAGDETSTWYAVALMRRALPSPLGEGSSRLRE